MFEPLSTGLAGGVGGAGLLLLERRLRGRQPGRQQTEWRAGDVVEADPVAEIGRLGIAAMLAADAHLESGPGLASLGRGHLHQLPYARLVKGGEGVLLEDARLHVGREELVDVVSADAVGCLSQVVGSEAEELGLFGDLTRER